MILNLLLIGIILIAIILFCKYHGEVTVFTWFKKNYGIHQVNPNDFAIFALYYSPFLRVEHSRWCREVYEMNKDQQRFWTTSLRRALRGWTGEDYNDDDYEHYSSIKIERTKKVHNTYKVKVIVKTHIDGIDTLVGTFDSLMCIRLSRKYLGRKKSITLYGNVINFPPVPTI